MLKRVLKCELIRTNLNYIYIKRDIKFMSEEIIFLFILKAMKFYQKRKKKRKKNTY